MIAFSSSVTTITKMEVQDIMRQLQVLADKRVLVGVPEEKDTRSSTLTPEAYKMAQIRSDIADRKATNSNMDYVSPQQYEANLIKKAASKSKPRIGNASLAYIHDNGAPSANIPARPFMKPGVAKAQERINRFLLEAARAKMNGDEGGCLVALHKTGMVAQNSIRNVIRLGENFAPLKRATLLARTRSTQSRIKQWHGDKAEREGIMGSMKPLIDTGQLLKSIIYVVVDDKSGSRQVGKMAPEGEA